MAVTTITDAWTLEVAKSFATYAAHCFDDNLNLQSYVLATWMFDGRHTAENVRELLCTVVKEFVSLRKITSIVHDEAANMVAAERQLHEEINR